MKRLSLFLIFVSLSCSSPVEEPKNLVPKDKMAALIADLAINDQMGLLSQTGNMETNTIYILKKYGVTSKQFTSSYKFYLAKPGTLEGIYDDAQTIIKEKDPAAEDFIKKKLKENPAGTAFSK